MSVCATLVCKVSNISILHQMKKLSLYSGFKPRGIKELLPILPMYVHKIIRDGAFSATYF